MFNYDRRVRMVMLSKQGHETLSRALPLWQEAQTQIVEGFGKERLDHLLQDLSTMAEMVHNS